MPSRSRGAALEQPGWGSKATRRVELNIQAPRDFIDRRQLVSALRALRRGDFSVRLPEEVDGVDGEIARLFNGVGGLNEEMTQEFERLSEVVGKEGKISQRARLKNARGGWETT